MKKITALLAAGAVLVAPLAGVLSGSAHAASLTDVTVSLSPETASTATDMTVTFTPVTAITNGTVIEVSYDTGFTGGAALTDADVTVTGTNITSTVESGFAAGYLRSTLTTSGNVTTPITIVIGDTNQLTSPVGGNYNVSVSVNVGGTGSSFDNGSGLAYVADENDLLVTAQVVSVIDFELYQQGSDTLLTDPNTCALGVLSVNNVNTCVYDAGFGTNSASGMTIKMTRDANGLNSGANNINPVADGTVSAGTEEYGFRITDAGTGCSATAAGTFGSQDNAVPSSATTVITTSAVCNGTAAGQSAKRAEFTHKASVDAATVVGSYDELDTFTAFSN